VGRIPQEAAVSVHVDADPASVWSVLADVTRVGEWSHECRGAQWVGEHAEPVAGARFRGRNKVGLVRWGRLNEIVRVDERAALVWRTLPALRYPDSTEWTVRLEPDGTGTRIVQSYRIVRMNPVIERIFAAVIPAHQDREDALRADLVRLGEVAATRRPLGA
jgi:uncharacterized protein YndB with AHSA1/START domain